MNIVIACPRANARYGITRVAIQMARWFERSGQDVTLVWAFGESVCDGSDPGGGQLDRIHQVFLGLPEDLSGLDLISVTQSRLVSWGVVQTSKADVVISLGWPFLRVGSVTGNWRTVLIDVGAVPVSDLHEQLWLRRARAGNLPLFDAVIPISDFLTRTQSAIDAPTRLGDIVFHLGGNFARCDPDSGSAPQTMADRKSVVILGRYEGGYKNSSTALQALTTAVSHLRADIHLLGSEPEAPRRLGDLRIFQHRFLSDAEYVNLLSQADLAISPSLWEGYNLPIAEASAVGTPVICFPVGAHAEVVRPDSIVPSSLLDEAIVNILSAPRRLVGRPQSQTDWPSNIHLLWDVVSALEDRSDTAAPVFFVNVTNAVADTGNSGVVRVTRCFIRTLAAAQCVVPVAWRGVELVHLGSDELGHLSHFGGPEPGDLLLRPDFAPAALKETIKLCGLPADPIFVDIETHLDGQNCERLNTATNFGFKTVGWIHDLIPTQHPELVSSDVASGYEEYLEARARHDRVVVYSEGWSGIFRKWQAERLSDGPFPDIATSDLPTGLRQEESAQLRELPGEFTDEAPLRLVAVGTLEPRKNYLRLITALDLVATKIPLQLDLVGNRYAGDRGLADLIRTLAGARPWLRLHGVASDNDLAELLTRAQIAVFPSLVEGFGMPIIEARATGLPCITHNSQTILDQADKGGCLSIDCRDVDGLANAVVELATDRGLYGELVSSGLRAKRTTWADYIDEALGGPYCRGARMGNSDESRTTHDKAKPGTAPLDSYRFGYRALQAKPPRKSFSQDRRVTVAPTEGEPYPIEVGADGENFVWLTEPTSQAIVDRTQSSAGCFRVQFRVAPPPGITQVRLSLGLPGWVSEADGDSSAEGYILLPRAAGAASVTCLTPFAIVDGESRRLYAHLTLEQVDEYVDESLFFLRSPTNLGFFATAVREIPELFALPTPGDWTLSVFNASQLDATYSFDLLVSNPHEERDRVRRVTINQGGQRVARRFLWRNRFRHRRIPISLDVAAGEMADIGIYLRGRPSGGTHLSQAHSAAMHIQNLVIRHKLDGGDKA